MAHRWRLEQLTINYRNPAEIAELADAVLAAIDAGLTAPRSVRHTGVSPRVIRTSPDTLAAELPALLARKMGSGISD